VIHRTNNSEHPGGLEGRRGSSLRRVLRRGRDERGTSLTEFALVLPLLLLLLLGMVDFGKALNYWMEETHLANEGARLAAVNNWPGKPGVSLQQYLLDRTGSEGTAELRGNTQGTQQTAHSAQVCIDYGTGKVGDPVTVTVSYAYDWLPYITGDAGIAKGLPGGQTTIKGTATMRLEAEPQVTGTVCT
jgi:Flp pilus assembly protein TadG